MADGTRNHEIPADWLAEFEAAARRPLEQRFRYAFIKTYKPVMDDADYRAWNTTAEYRKWCEENLPDWLGYGRAAVGGIAMPEISRFYGIVIRMFYGDHAPPHFHAVYGENEMVVGISPIAIREGRAPARVRSMVLEWAAVHQIELMENWERCQGGEHPMAIDPLD